MKIDESVWSLFQQHLGYTDEEMKLFRENPRNEEILAKAAGLMNKTIIAEVVESHGCNSRHMVGDKFYFDAAGNLLTRLCPEKVCMYALGGLEKLVFGANELLYAGLDANKMAFKRTGCPDVGVRCGGFGHIVMELKVEDRP
ncbi:hypothetical protein HZA56_21855 [Candidatus Poribacteria bacterium]|nr:hypothetical protein [Candidatus Poribacteria bacterium]